MVITTTTLKVLTRITIANHLPLKTRTIIKTPPPKVTPRKRRSPPQKIKISDRKITSIQIENKARRDLTGIKIEVPTRESRKRKGPEGAREKEK